ncbi:MAG: hypothetical protein IT459_17050 [Planctomycetes bacterium]|nr:hypothetical protein [Planctomycetota bacterium]
MNHVSLALAGKLRFTAIALLAFAWPLLLPVYDRPIPWLAWSLVACAIAALVAIGADARPPCGRLQLALSIGAVSVALLLPMPYRAGAAVLVLGLAFGQGRLRRLGSAMTAVGVAFLVQGAILVGWETLASATPALRMGSLVAPVLQWAFGVRSVSVDGQLFIGADELQGVATTLDSLGVLIPLLIAVPLWAMSTRGASPNRYAWLLVVYGVIRYSVIVAWSLEYPEHYSLLSTPLAITISYLPLLGLVWSASSPVYSGWTTTVTRLQPTTYALGASAAALLAFGLTGIDPGEHKPGRILVDDSHGAWESGTAERSLENFGTDSTYTYSAVWDWLGGYYPMSIKVEGSLTADELRGIDVLILKTPSKAYSAEERHLITDFVARGGGLFAIGDHTDVFGTTTVLNSVLQPVGLAIEKNVGLILNKRYVGDYRFRKDTFFANPLTHGIESAFDFMGPASVRVLDGHAEHVVQCQAQVLEAIDYRDTSFFGDRIVDLDDEVRPFYACVAKRFEAGRVVVWGDSTVFSNFSMFDPGKPGVILSIVSYLNKRNTLPSWWRPAARNVGLLLACGVVILLALRRTGEHLVSILSGAAAGLVCVALVGHEVQAASYREPAGDPDVTIVGFGMRDSAMGVDTPPGDGLAVEQAARAYDFESLFQAPMRVPHCFPRAVTDYEQLAGVDVLFLLDSSPISETDIEALSRAVDRGLRLVVVQGTGADARAKELLARYGLAFETYSDASIAISPAVKLPKQIAAVDSGALAGLDAALHLVEWEKELRGAPTAIAHGAAIRGVVGGTPIWVAGARSVPILAHVPAGIGSVHAFAAGELFRVAAMGGSSSVILAFDPQMESYRLFTSLLETVLDSGNAHAGHGSIAGHSHGTEHGDSAAHGAANHVGHDSPVEPTRELETLVASPNADEPGGFDAASVGAFVGPSKDGGALRARISMLLKNSSQAAFYGGYAAENGDGGYLRLAAENGSGRLSQSSPSATILLTPELFGLIPRGGAGAIGSRRGANAAANSLLSIPLSWSGESWTEATVTDDPWALVSRSLRDETIADLGRSLWNSDVKAGVLPADGWTSLPVDESFRVRRTADVVPLGGELVGRGEVWTGESTGRPRKIVMSFRLVGAVGEMDWYDLVILFDEYETHSDLPLEHPAELQRHIANWADLNEARPELAAR